MIYLLTGFPGAGKTTYLVASLQQQQRQAPTMTLDDGRSVKRRFLVAGVRGLLLPHERLPHPLLGDDMPAEELAAQNLMGKNGKPVMDRLPGTPPQDVACYLQNWWLWALPGDTIVCDEAQFVAPRASVGHTPPVWLQKLEVHRHYGVDFQFVTQHPELLATHIRKLTGQHKHLRPVLGSSRLMVYTWDYCSNPDRTSQAAKGTFKRLPAHYSLYKSAVAHTKQPAAGRGALALAGLLALGAPVGGYQWWSHKFNVDQAPSAAVAPTAIPGAATPPPVSFGPVAPAVQDQRLVAGCWAQAATCRCVSPSGAPVMLDRPTCLLTARSFEGLVLWQPSTGRRYGDAPPVPTPAASSVLPSFSS